jgi:hypothetical protein
MRRIAKVIKGKKGYFIQRDDAKINYDYKTKQFLYESEFITTGKLIKELKEQFDEGYPISADPKVLKSLEKLLDK